MQEQRIRKANRFEEMFKDLIDRRLMYYDSKEEWKA